MQSMHATCLGMLALRSMRSQNASMPCVEDDARAACMLGDYAARILEGDFTHSKDTIGRAVTLLTLVLRLRQAGVPL